MQRLQSGPDAPVLPKVQAPDLEQTQDPGTEKALDQVLGERAAVFVDSTTKPGTAGEGSSLVELRAAIAVADAGIAGDHAKSAADSAHGSLETAFLYTNPPGEPGASATPDKRLDVAADERTASITANAGSHSVSASVDRLGLTIDATRHDAGDSINAGAFLMKDWAMLWVAGGTDHADGSATGWDVGPYFDPTGGGLAATLSRKSVDGGVYRVGGFGGGNASRKLEDLGPYQGEQPALKGTRGVELRRELSADFTATPGMILSTGLGIGGRLGVAKESTLVYRTHLPPDQARSLLHEDGNKLTRALRNNARAIGLKDEPLPPPDLSKLDQLKVGDEVTLTTVGSLNGGLAVGAPAALGTVSLLGAMRGEFEISVTRTSTDQLDVTVVPTKVRGLELAGRAVILDAAIARASARSMAQRFRFDLNKPEAVQAYQALLQGELPSGGNTHDVDKIPPTRIGDEVLPAGVSRGPTEHVAGSGWRSHADIGFTLLTLGATVDRTRWERDIDVGDLRLHESARAVERRLTIPLSGDETRGVRASVMSASRYQGGERVSSEFARLRLVATVHDSKARGLELNRDIDGINQAFGLTLNHFSEKSLKKSRGIELTCELKASDLEQLATTDDATLRDTARESGTRASGLLVLKQTLAASSDPLVRAEAVQQYLVRAGFDGMGALVRLLGVDRVALTTSDGARDEHLAQAQALAFKYAQPLAADASNDEVSTRFEQVLKLDEKLVRVRALTDDDPLLKPEQRSQALAQVDKARAELTSCLNTEHLSTDQRHTLIDQLERGWTTRWEYRAIEALEPGAKSKV
ncbi:MAG: hypothetical protein ABIJ09_08110 [Pseudomonadota bacterium]